MQGHKDLETRALRVEGQARESTAYLQCCLPGIICTKYRAAVSTSQARQQTSLRHTEAGVAPALPISITEPVPPEYHFICRPPGFREPGDTDLQEQHLPS